MEGLQLGDSLRSMDLVSALDHCRDGASEAEQLA